MRRHLNVELSAWAASDGSSYGDDQLGALANTSRAFSLNIGVLRQTLIDSPRHSPLIYSIY